MDLITKNTYIKNIRTLINYLKSFCNFRISTVYRNIDSFKSDLNTFKKYNMKEEDVVYIEILERMANAKKPADIQIFSLTDNQQKNVYAYVNFLEQVFRTYQEDREKAIKMALDNEGSFNSFENSMKRLNNGYCNAILYKPMADDIISEMKKRKTTKADKNKVVEDINNDSIYHRVYNSGLSLLDYAHEHFIETNGIKSYFKPEISGCSKEMAAEIKSRKDKHLNEILSIIEMINDGYLDIVDYYKKTRLNPVFLTNLAKEHGLSSVKLACFVNKYKNPHHETKQIEKLIDGKLVIDHEEVSKETMVKVFNKMKEMDMVLKYTYYMDFLREDIENEKTLKRANN